MYACIISGVLAIASAIAIQPISVDPVGTNEAARKAHRATLQQTNGGTRVSTCHPGCTVPPPAAWDDLLLPTQRNFGAGCQFDDGQDPWFEIEIFEDGETGACYVEWPDEPAADPVPDAFELANRINFDRMASELIGERDWSRFTSGSPMDDYWASTGGDPSRVSTYQNMADVAQAFAVVSDAWLHPGRSPMRGASTSPLEAIASGDFFAVASEFFLDVIAEVESIREERLASAIRAGIGALAAEEARLQIQFDLLEEALLGLLSPSKFLVLNTALGDVELRLTIIRGRHHALVAALPDTEPAFAFESPVRALPDAG